MKIRLATDNDINPVWEIFKEVIRKADTYVFEPNTPKADLHKYWFANYMKTYVAEMNGKIIGTYIIKPNQVGLGSHIANCSYMVHPQFRRQGAGDAMCQHSIGVAKQNKYKAIQFNIVVSSNIAAINLWKKYGFEIVGTIPKAFKHTTLGFVDAYIMYLPLN